MSETSIKQAIATDQERLRLHQQVHAILHVIRDYVPPRLMPELQDRLGEMITSSDVVLISRAELQELRAVRESLTLRLLPESAGERMVRSDKA